MVVYYRGPSALITESWYVAYRPFRQIVPVPAISQTFGVSRGRAMSMPLLAGSSSTGVVLALATWSGWLEVNPPLWAAAALLAALAVSLGARVCLGDHGPVYQLWAVVYGVNVLLLETPDREEFGSVRRGLGRAMEAGSNW